MATISNTPRPGYVWDATDNVWYPIGVGGHGHSDYITQATAVNPTIIDAKGDIITATAADTPARLAVGNNGETLVADSTASTGLRWNATQSAGKNKCVNGGMDFWQRSTSNATTGYQTADRWYQLIAGTTTVSRDTDVPSGVPVQYSIKGLTSASSSYMQYQYSLESADVIPLRGQTVTFSWYMKKNSTWSGTFGSSNYYYSNSTDARASLATSVTTGYTNPTGITPTTSWVRFYETITIPSDAVGFQKQFNPDVAQASGAALWITGVQIEVGTSPTTFSRAGGTIQGELAACQRYYYQAASNTIFGMYGWFFAYNTTTGRALVQNPVPMRTAATSVTYSNLTINRWGSGTFAFTTLVIQDSECNTIMTTIQLAGASGLTANGMYQFANNNNAAGYLGISAEL